MNYLILQELNDNMWLDKLRDNDIKYLKEVLLIYRRKYGKKYRIIREVQL